MERDFEKEFIELKLSEVPDLWNRIEAGLSEKRTVNSVPAGKSGYGKGYTVKRPAWRRWGTLAAACLCVAIIYPMISLVLRNMGNKSSSYSGAVPNDTARAEDTGAMSDAAPAEDFTESGAAESFGYADGTEMAGSADMEASAEAAEAVEETAQDIDASNSLQSETAADIDENAETEKSDVTDMAEEKESAAAYVLEDGQILEDIVVCISEADTSGYTDLYQAVVIQADADMVLMPEMRIEIFCDSETAYDFLRGPRQQRMLKEGEDYVLSLRYEKLEDRFAVITAAKEK